jgi:hypothetical protein
MDTFPKRTPRTDPGGGSQNAVPARGDSAVDSDNPGGTIDGASHGA